MSTNLVTGKSKKHRQLGQMIGNALNNLQGISEKDENAELINIIFRARQEMLDAQNYFDNVTDNELVDHAIYKMEAAKSQYVYLLKLAKDRGLSVVV
ncbi:MAG TPA: YaaL family protein [Patescibacteria group bacterium]|nr:YaaL family protein [Patescibacteria group bacterium]